ncbi:protein-glutamate O-methyltransferase family protein [Streptomyces sp. IBSBF 2953]|uniref:damage-control phosphatase ARMT1 family protein n=1 Tax=Streptomyces TaxID=1883 RepID=UPI00211A3E27|nr:damage-control phosphatase ARMT1 family protein [Streptomyces scabiei]MCQ9182395.1 protein-glutamate O-methyltransferase family protein [Streptomyces hayashii]MDX3117913.1 damage-control phosphatase ARMT1 family protein [Streptomyces scabiei]
MSRTPALPVILGNEPGSFPRSVLAERHPAIIRQVRDAFPYGPDAHRALDALADSCAEGVIEPLPQDAHDRDRWRDWGLDGYVGRSWFDVPWLWSESYFYRRLLDAVGYFGPGPWAGIDPFRPFKLAELDAVETDEELTALDSLADRPVEERGRALLHGSLWGNRADLGFRLSDGAAEGRAAVPGLVADDSEALWSLLAVTQKHTRTHARAKAARDRDGGRCQDGDQTRGGDGSTGEGAGEEVGAGTTLCLVADNAGRELVPDLLLVAHLLDRGHCDRVVLHVKPYPYYVSDATTADVVDALRKLTSAGGAAADHGRRLWAAMADGALTVRAHPFSAAPLPYSRMPDDLRAEFAGAALTIVKGDLNYRRLVGDSRWAPTTPFADVAAHFPGPVVALRTLKSDVITGLDAATEAALVAAEGQRWRTGGTHALIQMRE